MVFKRRKGVAIVDTDKGILVVSGKKKVFTLPGGGAEKLESRKKASIRELYEETGLRTKKIIYLFKDVGDIWYNSKRKPIQNYTKFFLIKHKGNPFPGNEIKYVSFWKIGSKLQLSKSTKKAIERYFRDYKKIGAPPQPVKCVV